MTLSDDVNVEDYIMSKDDLSGADIKAICTEAGLMALRYGKNETSFLFPFFTFIFSFFQGTSHEGHR